MVKIADAIDSGAIHRSIPVFDLDDSSAEHSTDRQALNTHISDVLRAVNNPGAGLLLYTLPDTLDSRVVVGGSGSVYIVACNAWRKLKRAAFNASEVFQPFDDASFHFLKADVDECIAWLRIDSSQPTADACPFNDTLLLLNNAPLTARHFLVVPRPAAHLPQVLTPYAARVAVKLCRSLATNGDKNILVGFNSICAYASVNHLHLHAYHIALAPQQEQELKDLNSSAIPALHRPTMPLHCSRDFPVSVVAGVLPAFRIDALATEAAFNVLLAVIEVVHSHRCAHNVLFLSDGSGDVSALVYCRSKAVGVKDAGTVQVAISELSGHVFAKSRDSYDKYSGAELDAMVEEIQLPPDVYRSIADDVLKRVLLLQSEWQQPSQPSHQDHSMADSAGQQREQLLETIAQLQGLRTHLRAEIDVLRSQIGAMQCASQQANAELERTAAATAEQHKRVKEHVLHDKPAIVAPPVAFLNYLFFAMVALICALACGKYFSPLVM